MFPGRCNVNTDCNKAAIEDAQVADVRLARSLICDSTVPGALKSELGIREIPFSARPAGGGAPDCRRRLQRMPIPDFVLALRSHVGNELLWMPGVSAVVIHEDGRLLLGRRADNGLWAVVSGILEPGEQPALAALREVLEETGILAVVEGLASVSSSPETVQYENGDRAQYLDLTFLCRAVGTDDPWVADDESTAVGWFEADALPAPLMESSRSRIAQALAYRAHPENGTWFARPQPLSGSDGRNVG